MTMGDALSIALRLAGVLVLVALNGFFVSAEFAIVSARRTRLEQLAAAGNATANLIRSMQDNLGRTIAATQLGVTLMSLALGAIGEPTIAELVDPPIEALIGFVLGNLPVAQNMALAISHAVGVAVSFFIITSLHIVLGEQSPKVLSIRAPERTALFVAPALMLFSRVFGLVTRFLDWATATVLRIFGLGGSGGYTRIHSAEELRLLVEESGEAGALEAQEQEMLINVFAFADRPAYQAMLPRTEVATVGHDATIREFLDRFVQTGHTRFPVVGPGGVDDVKGIISAKDLLVALHDGSVTFDQPITSLIRPAFFTPESKRIGDLLSELRAKHIRMAILIDEYGGMAGVVTMEDLVEEIVGDLDKLEHDHTVLKTIDERTSVVEGQIRVEDVNEELNLDIPPGDYETLAGFILARLGRLPSIGDSVNYKSVRLTVLEMQGPRIKRIEITRM
jgi:CBS domain containing-hemolysin-like protein